MINLRQIYQETIGDCFEGEFHEPGESKLYKSEVQLDSLPVATNDTKLSVEKMTASLWASRCWMRV